ncbi:hypothetical protein LC76P1_00177 [Lysinibacillus phage LC76P1]|nr:hypothetical protein LC76P1_00177 [Lysinibacillus phage LC76P1]
MTSHSKFDNIDLSNTKTISALIKFKNQQGMIVDNRNGLMYNTDIRTGMNEDVYLIYLYLDELIEKADLTKEQELLLDFKSKDCYTMSELGEKFGVNRNSIKVRLETIYKRIANAHKLTIIEQEYLRNPKAKYRTCGTCKKDLPATMDFFPANSYSYDQLHSVCKKCHSQRKKKNR